MFSSIIAAADDWVERDVLIEDEADALEVIAAPKSSEHTDPADVPSQLRQRTCLIRWPEVSLSRPSRPRLRGMPSSKAWDRLKTHTPALFLSRIT